LEQKVCLRSLAPKLSLVLAEMMHCEWRSAHKSWKTMQNGNVCEVPKPLLFLWSYSTAWRYYILFSDKKTEAEKVSNLASIMLTKAWWGKPLLVKRHVGISVPPWYRGPGLHHSISLSVFCCNSKSLLIWVVDRIKVTMKVKVGHQVQVTTMWLA
jgi:hypothetical protein